LQIFAISQTLILTVDDFMMRAGLNYE